MKLKAFMWHNAVVQTLCAPEQEIRLADSEAGRATSEVSGVSSLLEGELLTGTDDENSRR